MSGAPPPPAPGALPAVQRQGQARLHLDAAPVRPGRWLTGLVEVPERLRGSDIRLFVECVRTSSVPSFDQRYRWFSIALIDGSRLETQAGRAFVPFAVLLPVDAPPTSHDERKRGRVEWRLRVLALRPGARFSAALEETFELSVEPSDEIAPAVAPAPRAMPELAPEDVARRLRARVERAGDALVIHFPFPAGAAATALVSAAVFVLAGLAYVLPGFSWAPPAASGFSVAVAVVSGGLSAFMLLVLLMSLRTLEVRPETVRMTRGLFGLGFHRSLPARDVTEVVENPFVLPNASPRFYGVALRMRDGTLHGAAPRMPDPASARALAQLLSSLLPRA